VAIATYSLAVGGLCPEIETNVGALSSQAFVNPELRFLGMNLLASGHAAERALELALLNDPQHEFRQVGFIDREGRTAVHTGASTRGYSGHIAKPNYAVFGNVLESAEVIQAMSAAFENSDGESLPERLVRTLEAGKRAGGQRGTAGPLPERSASIVVHGSRRTADLDLRIDMHADAVTQLRILVDEYLPYVEYHRSRWLDPASAMPQEIFVRQLQERRALR
jgi:uncharacterized Ntn-hydrolase superfamily protein